MGDDAFALRPYLIKPYGTKGLARGQKIFNYRLSRARRAVENAFGILANRIQVLLSTMQQTPDTVELIAKACILLHNLMRTRYPRMQNDLMDRVLPNGVIVDGAWRRGRNLEDSVNVPGHDRPNREG